MNLPPRCKWTGHSWPNHVTFKPYYPAFRTIDLNFSAPVAAFEKIEAYGIQRCEEQGCHAIRVLDYDGKEVPRDDPRYQKALDDRR